MRDWSAGRELPAIHLMDRLASRAPFSLTWLYFNEEKAMLPAPLRRLTALIDRDRG